VSNIVSKALNALSECEDSVQHEKLCISNMGDSKALGGSKAIANEFPPCHECRHSNSESVRKGALSVDIERFVSDKDAEAGESPGFVDAG